MRIAIEAEPRLSIVIPALNEARRLPTTLERLHEYLTTQAYSHEIIVVSNGSADDTDAVVREAMGRIPALRLISVRERGKGLASRIGALQSRGQVVFLCDADLSMPPASLQSFLDRIGRSQVVIGSREAPGSRRYGEPWHRHAMGRIFNKVVQMLAVPGIEDTQCGFKAFEREAAQELFSRQTLNGFGFDAELLFLARKLGYRVEEIGIDWYFDADTRVRPGVDSIQMLGEVLMIRLRDLLGRYQSRAASREGEHVAR